MAHSSTRAVSWCHGPWHSTEHTSSRACRYRLQPAPGYRLSPSARHCHVHIRARQTPACACSGQATAALATVGALAGGDHGEARTAARRARRAATTGTTAAASLVTLMAAAASMVGTRVADSDCCPHQWIVARGPETKRGERCTRECSGRGGASQRCRPARRRMKGGLSRRGCALHDESQVVCTQVGAASPDSQHRAVATGTAHGRRTAFGLVNPLLSSRSTD